MDHNFRGAANGTNWVPFCCILYHHLNLFHFSILFWPCMGLNLDPAWISTWVMRGLNLDSACISIWTLHGSQSELYLDLNQIPWERLWESALGPASRTGPKDRFKIRLRSPMGPRLGPVRAPNLKIPMWTSWGPNIIIRVKPPHGGGSGV